MQWSGDNNSIIGNIEYLDKSIHLSKIFKIHLNKIRRWIKLKLLPYPHNSSEWQAFGKHLIMILN